MADFILEIGTEEIPARFLADTKAELLRHFTVALHEQELAFEEVTTFTSPRRASIYIKNLAKKQEVREEVFSSKTHSTRSASRVSRVDDGIGVHLLGDVVQLGKNVESLSEEPYQEPIEDCTTNPQAKHIDKKRLRELKDKGMTQSM